MGGALLAAATLGCLAFGCISVLRVVGPPNLRAAPDDGHSQPIVFDDHALTFYYGRLGSHFLAEAGRSHGYDPNFLSGYPKSPVYYPSSRPFELSLWLFAGLDEARVFNWTVFVLLAACPFLTYAAAAVLGLSHGERLVVAALTTIPHLLVPIADFYGYMEAAGMEPYIFASALSVLVAALVARFVRSGGVMTGVALWAAAPVLYFTHPTAVVISAVPIAAIYLVYLRAMPGRRHLWLLVVLATVLVTSWPWIEGQLLFGHYADLREFYSVGGRAHFTPRGGLLSPFRTFVPEPKVLSLLPPLLGCIGLALWWRERRGDLLLVVFPQLFFLFVISYYGIFLGLAAVAPGRITWPLGLYLFFPAAHALVAGIRGCANAGTRLARGPVGGFATVLGLAVAAALGLRGAGLETKVWRVYTLPTLEQSQGFTLHGAAFLQWLRDRTDGEGRLLHEETDRASHQYYGSHLAALFPLYTGRVLAGGPAPHALLQHNVLRFEAGTLLGQPLDQMPVTTVARYLTLYNVRWVLCWTAQAKRYFAAFPQAAPVGSYDKFTLYRVNLTPSYFLEGTGTIETQENRIVLHGVTPQAGRIALKYHWLETLRTSPPREIQALSVPEDPVPFIVVVDPPRELVIYNDYRAGMGAWLEDRLGALRARLAGG